MGIDGTADAIFANAAAFLNPGSTFGDTTLDNFEVLNSSNLLVNLTLRALCRLISRLLSEFRI